MSLTDVHVYLTGMRDANAGEWFFTGVIKGKANVEAGQVSVAASASYAFDTRSGYIDVAATASLRVGDVLNATLTISKTTPCVFPGDSIEGDAQFSFGDKARRRRRRAELIQLTNELDPIGRTRLSKINPCFSCFSFSKMSHTQQICSPSPVRRGARRGVLRRVQALR